MWLVGPLIAKLPNSIQGRVLKLAGQVLESGNNLFVSAKSKQENDRNQKRYVSTFIDLEASAWRLRWTVGKKDLDWMLAGADETVRLLYKESS